jgi:hypothetical protein
MARYVRIDTSPRFLAVNLKAQLLHGTFESALNHLLDHEIGLSDFDACFNSHDTGAAAFPPAMLAKVVLLARSLDNRSGLICRRGIERLGHTCGHTPLGSRLSFNLPPADFPHPKAFNSQAEVQRQRPCNKAVLRGSVCFLVHAFKRHRPHFYQPQAPNRDRHENENRDQIDKVGSPFKELRSPLPVELDGLFYGVKDVDMFKLADSVQRT